MRTKNTFERYVVQHDAKLHDLGADIVKQAFIYQNNLFIHFFDPTADKGEDKTDEHGAMDLLYQMYHIQDFAKNYFVEDGRNGDYQKVRNNYVDFNGARLSEDVIAGRHTTLKFDLLDVADMIRENIWDKRIEVYNSIKKSIVDHIERISSDKNFDPNPYLSRVELIIPMNLLHILTNITYDNTTDILDLAEAVSLEQESILKTEKTYLRIPEIYRNKVMYTDIDAYPRYVPLYIPQVLKPQWNWLMYQNIKVNADVMNYIDRLHFQGHYLFSYEKSHILKNSVKEINDDIRSNHIDFYLTDLSMGIAFPFMISLFAFIHLKTEIAFILMFKNRIREILFIFWLLPVSLMLLVKGGILAAYLFYLMASGFGLTAYIALPLSLTIFSAAVVFYPINQWCFSPFIGDMLNLHALQKGN